ncbi:MAG TPA: acyl-CoA dehydrogenase family protein [Dehalococcoidia bacterium]|nr:acyl-CoA dehydrogenase family protein [Dehalococcoidia bacterium]
MTTTTQPSDSVQASPLDAARALAPLLRTLADQTERERRLPPEAVDAMRQAGLFHLTVPRDLHGLEAEPLPLMQAIEEVAAADGSAGWCVMIAAQNAALAGFAQREAAMAMVGAGGIIAGTARPIGRAVPADGGCVVSGRWPFASGSSHADWFAGECLRYEGGGDQPQRDEAGNAVSYMAFLPREQVTVHDTWFTTGLRGTASNDFSVDGVFVPDAFLLRMMPVPWHPWPFYRTLALMFTTHGAHALGLGRAAVEAAVEAARRKIGWGTDRPLAEQGRLQLQVAEAFVLVESAREHLHGAAGRLWGAAQRGEDLGRLNSRVRLATSHAATASWRAVDLLHGALGTSSVFAGSPLERQFRDMRTAAAHVMVGPLTYEAAGRVELDLPAGMPFF